MNNTTGVIVGALIVILVIVGVLSYQRNNNDEAQDQSGGSLYVGVTDASADISGVNDIDLSVKKVEVHSAAKGWMTVSSDSKKYSLLALKGSGKTELYAKKDGMEAGTYDKVRVTFGDAVVRTKANGDVKAVMPASQMVLNTMIKVSDGQNTHFKFDVMADKSLHSTSDNKYVFAPVVAAEARSNANITESDDNFLTVTGGSVDSNSNVGVDLSGASRSDFTLTTDSTLKINSSVGNTLNFMLGGKTYESDNSKVLENQMNMDGSANANMNANTSNSSSDANTQGGINLDVNGALNGN